MFDALIGALLGKVAPQYIEYRAEKRRLKQEVELEKLRGKAKWEAAKTARAESSEGRDHEWEILSLKNSGYKDEWVLGLVSIPMIMSFVPVLQYYVKVGFDTLEGTPPWYRVTVMTIFFAVYGIRLWRRKLPTE